MLFATLLLIGSGSQIVDAAPSQSPPVHSPSVTATVDLGAGGTVRVGVPTPISVTVAIDASVEPIPVIVELETFDSMYRTHIDADAFVEGQFTWNVLTHHDDPWAYVSVYDMDGTLLTTADATERSVTQTTVLGVGSTLLDELMSWAETGGQLLGTHPGTSSSDSTIEFVDAAHFLDMPTQLNALSMVVLSGEELRDLTDSRRVLLHEWITFGGELILITTGDDASQLVSLLSGGDKASDDEASGGAPVSLPANLRYGIGLGSIRILSRDEGPAWTTLLEQPGLSTDQVGASPSASAQWTATQHEFVETNHVSTRTLAVGLVGFIVVVGPILWGAARLLGRPMLVGPAVVVVGVATAMSLLTYTSRTHEARETLPLTAMDLVGESARIETVLPFISSNTIEVADTVVLRSNPITADRFGDTAGRFEGVRIEFSDTGAELHTVAGLGSPAAAHLEGLRAQHDAIVTVDVLSNDGSTVILEITNVARSILYDVAITMNDSVVVIEQLDVGRPYEVVISPPSAIVEPRAGLPSPTARRDGLVELPGGELLGRSLSPLPIHSSLISITGRWPHWEPATSVNSESIQALFAPHGRGELYFRQVALIPSPVDIQVVGSSDRFIEHSLPTDTDDLDGATAERIAANTIHKTYRLTIPGTIVTAGAVATLRCETPTDVVNVEQFNGTTWVDAVPVENTDSGGTLWSVVTVATTGAAYLNIELAAQDPLEELPVSGTITCEVSP